MKRRMAAGLAIGAAAAAMILALDAAFALTGRRSGFHPLDTIELKTYDWRLSWTAEPSTARPDIALIEIDEYSLRNLQPNAGRWPWPRAVHSMLVDYLARAPAKVIVYDVNFAEPDTRKGFDFGDSTWSGEESDRALIDSVSQAGNVILLADATYEATAGQTPGLPNTGLMLEGEGVLERPVVFPPFAALARVAADLGHNLFVLDPDGPIRHIVPFVRSGGHVLPSLGVAAAIRIGQIPATAVRVDGTRLRLGDRRMPLSWRTVRTSDGVQRYQWALVNFRGPALLSDLKSRTYPTFSFFDLLYSEEQLQAHLQPKVDPSIFKDKLVFVGVTASGLYDVFETPFSRGKMPGIQVHAAVADDILSHRFMRPVSDPVRVASVIVSALAIGVVAALFPAWWAAGIALMVAAIAGSVATQLFANGYWVNVTQPILSASVALFGGVAYQYLIEGREKRKMKRLFGQYVSRDVYEQLVTHPELARLGGQRREMTVLFSDIRGFTMVTEQGRPEEIVGMLNEYFTRMVEVVFRHRGTVDKFVGDMVMALFGAPLDDPQHADHAVAAALDMIEELSRLNERWRAEGRIIELDIGIGINTGPMIAGNIGSEQIMSYTVIGDAVNLGSRLESLNKQHGTRIIISDATRQALIDRYVCRPLGEVVVKGKSQPVTIFEVVGRALADTAAAAEQSHVGRSRNQPKEARV